MADFDLYQSPFSWRYGNPEMRALWSEVNKRKTWRRIWIALARCESAYGLVSEEQVAELESRAGDVDIEESLKVEARIHHDLMAELKVFAAQCPLAGGILHLGATSMDIEDNADALRIRAALSLLLPELDALLLALADKIDAFAGLPVIAFTHLQPAEPTTLGYRFASYAQDILEDHDNLLRVREGIRGKGFKGAVGTAASFYDLIGAEAFSAFETALSRELDLPFFDVATQTYPRKQDFQVVAALAGLGASLYKFAFDLRVLQSPPIGELGEPFGSQQVGSSAMPFKRNPINAEKIDSLARQLSTMPLTAWNNAGHSLLERTLDDSANRRTLLPEAFLITDELVRTAHKIVAGLNVNETAIRRNLTVYGPFAATERLMMEAVRRGADRQAFHELLRKLSLDAWQEVQAGLSNRLVEMIQANPEIVALFGSENSGAWLNIDTYTGLSAGRARDMAIKIRSLIRPR